MAAAWSPVRVLCRAADRCTRAVVRDAARSASRASRSAVGAARTSHAWPCAPVRRAGARQARSWVRSGVPAGAGSVGGTGTRAVVACGDGGVWRAPGRGSGHTRQFSAAPKPSKTSQSYNVVRFVDTDGNESYGTLAGVEEAKDGAGVPGPMSKVYYVRPIQQMGERHKWKALDERTRVARFLPPVEPVSIYCLGLNYHKHAVETGHVVPKFPVIFLKPVTSVIAHRHEIVIPSVARSPPEVDFEGELAVVIGRDCKNVTAEEALDYVLGYTIANDVTARRWQGRKGGGQWCRGKAFDTFCPLGPGIVPANRLNPDNVRITTRLNGEVMQDSTTADMVFSVAEIISFLSQDTTLLHGTVILTGTPEGVGFTREPPRFLSPGDVVEVSIEGLGTLVNPVVAEASPSAQWQ